MIKTDQTEKLSKWRKFAIFTMVVLHFQLLFPLGMSDNPVLRLFTNYKVWLYFSFFTFVCYFLHDRRMLRRFLRNIPALKITSIYLLWMAISTILAYLYVPHGIPYDRYRFLDPSKIMSQHSGSFMIGTQVLFYLYSIACAVVIRSFGALEVYFKYMLFAGFVIACIMISGALGIGDLLPNLPRAKNFAETTYGQTHIYSSASSGPAITRTTFLWFDSNNIAVRLVPTLLYLFYALVSKSSKARPSYLQSVVCLSVIGLATLETLSRTAFISCLLGYVLLSRLLRPSPKKSLFVAIGCFGFIMSALLAYLGGFKKLAQMVWRVFLMTGTIGVRKADLHMGGLEIGRISSTIYGLEDFLDRPLLGWGVTAKIGAAGSLAAGNHVGWVNVAGKYGVIGLTLYMCIIGAFYASLMTSIKYLRNKGDLHADLGYLIGVVVVCDLLTAFTRTIPVFNHVAIIAPFCFAVETMRKRDKMLQQ